MCGGAGRSSARPPGKPSWGDPSLHPLFLFPEALQNGPEPSRAHEYRRRSEPLTARTVLQNGNSREGGGPILSIKVGQIKRANSAKNSRLHKRAIAQRSAPRALLRVLVLQKGIALREAMAIHLRTADLATFTFAADDHRERTEGLLSTISSHPDHP